MFACLSPDSQTIHWPIVPPCFHHLLEQFSALALTPVACGILTSTDVVPHHHQPLWADPSAALRTKNLQRGLGGHLCSTSHMRRTEPYFHRHRSEEKPRNQRVYIVTRSDATDLWILGILLQELNLNSLSQRGWHTIGHVSLRIALFASHC